MSLAEQIRTALRDAAHPGLTVEEIYARCSEADSVDKVRTNMSPFVTRGEVESHKQLGSTTKTYMLNPRYKPGAAATPAPAARTITGRDNQGDDEPEKKARRPSAEAPKEAPKKKPRKKREPKPFKAAKRSKRAKPLPRISRRSKRKIKEVIRHAQPIELQTVEPARIAVFGIRDDGALGIDVAGEGEAPSSNVRLPREEVARLRTFLDTTKPLWS